MHSRFAETTAAKKAATRPLLNRLRGWSLLNEVLLVLSLQATDKNYTCKLIGRHGTKIICITFQHNISAVIHFAALKAVGESMASPLKYYKVNVSGTCNLMQVKQALYFINCSLIRLPT